MGALDLSLDNRVILDTPLDCAIQELDLLFNSVNTELIGSIDFGTNFEQFLWTLTPSTEALKKYVESKIAFTYFASQFEPEVSIRTETGDLRDIYYVEIKLHVESDDKELVSKSRRVYMLT